MQAFAAHNHTQAYRTCSYAPELNAIQSEIFVHILKEHGVYVPPVDIIIINQIAYKMRYFSTVFFRLFHFI